MSRHPALAKIVALAVLIGVMAAIYLLWLRPYQLTWGATAAEIVRPMPGDGLDSTPTFLATRAITIDATPAAIWPWLIQMGYGRAGFYGYDLIENVGSPRGIRSADRPLPQFQHFKVGDEVPISAVAAERFSAIEPNRYLVWAGKTGPRPGGFTWALCPIDAQHTRLVSRIRWSHHPVSQPWPFLLDSITELTDHLAVREVLAGVKGRVEGHPRSDLATNLDLAVYILSFIAFLATIVWVVLRPLTWPRWLAGVGVGLGWLLTWYGPFPLWAPAPLEFGLAWYALLWRPWQLHWGATAEEVASPMLGDDIVTHPSFDATRAVTVHARPERIYPWIVQMGLGRAGWYSYDILDNLGRPSAEEIVPELQHPEVGSIVPMSPDGTQGVWVKEFERDRCMLWWDRQGDMTWLWELVPIDGQSTRLITRVRMKYRWLSLSAVFNLLIEFADWPMMRKSMLGIKRRAEALAAARQGSSSAKQG